MRLLGLITLTPKGERSKVFDAFGLRIELAYVLFID